MSCCHGSEPQEVRPGTARILVTELSGSGYINPTPASKSWEDSQEAVEFYLSPEKLESLCGTRDLSHVTSLEVCVDTQENSLGNFGAYLPRLVQLKMNNSVIMSVRDVGTTLSHLQVLWMSRCHLRDLDGISTFSSLKELYVAYNNVSELSPVGMLENLELLDLEGNDVDDLVQIQYLGLCSKLQTLTLEGNPVCLRPNQTFTEMPDYSYRAAVRELIPQLRYLDDVKVEEDRLSCCNSMGEDWDILRNCIRDCNSSQAANNDEETARPYSRHSSASRPSSSLSFVGSMSSSGSRPQTGSRPMSTTTLGVLSTPGSRPGSADSDLAAVEEETSVLTHGAGRILFCGNPVQAIRARREKMRTAPTRSSSTPRDLPIHVPEHTYDLEETDIRECVNVFAELRAWREQHSSRLQAIEKERSPQVLAIQHGVEEEADSEEEEGFSAVRSDSSDEEHCGSIDTTSPHSSLQALSSDHREVLSPDMARLSLSPEATVSPSPPLGAADGTVSRKLPVVRARRLRLSQASTQHDSRRERCSSQTGLTSGDTNMSPLHTSSHVPHPPSTRALGEGAIDSCLDRDFSGVQSGHKHKTSKKLERSTITRPHTAMAALQKHHQHHMLQPCRGSSHPD